MDKKIIIFVMAVLVVLGGVIIFSKSQPNANVISAEQIALFDATKVIDEQSLPEGFNNDGQTPATTASNTYDNWSGARDAKVTLMEYGDFACSHCAQYNPILEAAREKYADRIAFIFRHYLLGGAYVNSAAAATSAEAAARQGQFWAMHNILFETQNDWFYADVNTRKGIFQGYAEQIGLDIDQWSRDYDNYQTNGIKTKIDFQVSMGQKNFDIAGTPTIIINGHKLDAEANPDDKWTTQEALEGIIERYLKETEAE
jgi:protein-disulfide isomerase